MIHKKVLGGNMVNILINNIRYVNPTSLIRALRNLPHFQVSIWGTDTEHVGYFPSSMFVDHYYIAPSVDNPKDYLIYMQKLCKDNDIHIIIPGSDKDVQFYSQYKEYFTTKIILPEKKAVNTFYDKYKASLAIKDIGVPIPQIINNLFDETKVIFRKKISSSSAGIFVLDLEHDKQIPNLFNKRYFLQRFINGTEYTVDILADKNGIPKLIIPRKRLQIRNGMSVCCQVCYHEKIIELCKKIYSHFYIPGLSNIQFIDDGAHVYFIEINMRFAGSGICGIIASFNYLEQYLCHFLNDVELSSLEFYMNKVAWSSIVSRYYEESIYHQSDAKEDEKLLKSKS